jgi:ketosteroid isomerase-like protein
MSGGNAEQVRHWVEAYNRGDLDAMLADLAPEHEWVVARQHPAATTHRGHDEIRAYHEDWLRMLPGMRFEEVEVEESANRVLMMGRIQGSGAASGAGAVVTLATITTFRNGVPVRTEEFLDPDEARRRFKSE